MFNRKQKSKKIVKKSVSALIATALAVNSGAALMLLNKPSTHAAFGYTDDSSENNITRIMMDGQNFLAVDQGYWMNAVTAPTDPAPNPPTYIATLKFKIPGYNSNNLNFYIFNRNQNMPANMKKYQLSSGLSDPTPSIYLTDLEASSYEVHVYNGALVESNFVCKSDFSVQPENDWQTNSTADLQDAAGRPLTDSAGVQLQTTYVTPTTLGTNQFFVSLPSSVVPYWANTVKVAFFATDRPNNASPNMDKCLYDYCYKGTLGSKQVGPSTQPVITGSNLLFVPDAQFGTATTTEYEAHFYVDEVKPENFICKAVGIVNS